MVVAGLVVLTGGVGLVVAVSVIVRRRRRGGDGKGVKACVVGDRETGITVVVAGEGTGANVTVCGDAARFDVSVAAAVVVPGAATTSSGAPERTGSDGKSAVVV